MIVVRHGGGGPRNPIVWIIVLTFAIGIVVAFSGLVLGVCAAFSPIVTPFADLLGDFGGVDTRDLPGDARAFAPFEALPKVADHAGEGAKLISIEVSLVRADGTLDLKAKYSPQPAVTYVFAREVPRPDDAAPPGAGGANNGPWHETITIRAYEPGQRRQRTTTTNNARTTIQYTNKGLDRTAMDPTASPVAYVNAPACALTALWAAALAKGAPADAVARITYDATGYRFSITGLRVALRFDAACTLIEG